MQLNSYKLWYLDGEHLQVIYMYCTYCSKTFSTQASFANVTKPKELEQTEGLCKDMCYKVWTKCRNVAHKFTKCIN